MARKLVQNLHMLTRDRLGLQEVSAHAQFFD